MSIKTSFEFPRGEDESDVVKQGQRLSQDLSKNFKSIKKALDTVVSYSQTAPFQKYFDFSNTWTGGAVFTIAHGLGQVPNGWFVIDSYAGGSSVTVVSPTRISWDATNISIYFSAGTTVTLKIRVFV